LGKNYCTYAKDKEVLDKLALEFNITNQSDWLRISEQDIKNKEGGSLLLERYNGSLQKGTRKVGYNADLL
jgi:hypothetical protein